ncbi:hypothetical protein MJO28_003128 [Puccinia striiformis f. sp. tritici]|uniref:Uncharacterized protein n=1 Tax=Puccinia striiformis f. sp. tritici TaxID=168172 RepID=A0ACC0ERU1_9BASI|nr:hypothetical protein MJO28_003128 [Puccinia striiformis f. sp. tritici]KAI7965098.1 hypothetical protein MJO29_003196 [Puccinia striiformis f. sp. tritici]
MAFPPLPAEFDWKKFLAVTTLVNALGKFVEKIPPFLEKHSGTVATFFAGHLAKTSPDTAMWALLGLVITVIFCFMLHKLLAPQQAKFTEQQMTALRQDLTEVIKSEFLKLSAQSATPEQQLITTIMKSSQTPFKHYLNSCHIFLLLRKHFKNNAEILEENFGAIFSEDGHQLQAHISLRSGSSRSSSRTAYSRRFTSIKMNELCLRQRRRYQDRGGKRQYDCESRNQQERELTTSCCMETNQARLVKKAVPTDSLFTSFSRANRPSADGALPDIRQRLELDCQLVILITLRVVNFFAGKALRYEDGIGEDI